MGRFYLSHKQFRRIDPGKPLREKKKDNDSPEEKTENKATSKLKIISPRKTKGYIKSPV